MAGDGVVVEVDGDFAEADVISEPGRLESLEAHGHHALAGVVASPLHHHDASREIGSGIEMVGAWRVLRPVCRGTRMWGETYRV